MPLPPKPSPTRVTLPRATRILRELHTDAPPLFDTLASQAVDYQRRSRMAKAEARDSSGKPRKKIS